MDLSKYNINYQTINGKEYISDVDAERVISLLDKRNLVLSMRFGREDWKDEKGYCCILNILDNRNDYVVSGIKIHCENINGYDYIPRQEFERAIRDYL